MAFTRTYDDVISLTNCTILKQFIDTFYNLIPDQSVFFGDANAIPSRLKIFTIKTSKDNYLAAIPALKSKYDVIAVGSEYTNFSVGDFKIKILITRKTKAISSQDAMTTKKQEEASLFAIEMGLKNIPFTIDDIKQIHPECSSSWYQCYIQQSQAIKSFWGHFSGKYVFNHTGGFMDFISNKARELGYRQKDAWNPADVWIIRKDDETLIKATIDGMENIGELNDYLITLLNERKLVGISLKKTGLNARVEVSNIIKNQQHKSFSFDRMVCSFELDSVNKLKTAQGMFFIDDYRLQCRQFPFKSNSNTQLEIASRKAESRLGKVPKDGVRAVLEQHKFTVPTWRVIPKDKPEFMRDADHWLRIFKTVNIVAETGITNDEFIPTMLQLFDHDELYVMSYVNCKLQALMYAYAFAFISPDSRDDVATKLVYLAKKEDINAGPFVKIY